MFIQFGYVVLFSSAFPLAALCALLNNIIEIRSDAFKLCTNLRRPFGERVENIGTWQVTLANRLNLLSMSGSRRTCCACCRHCKLIQGVQSSQTYHAFSKPAIIKYETYISLVTFPPYVCNWVLTYHLNYALLIRPILWPVSDQVKLPL